MNDPRATRAFQDDFDKNIGNKYHIHKLENDIKINRSGRVTEIEKNFCILIATPTVESTKAMPYERP